MEGISNRQKCLKCEDISRKEVRLFEFCAWLCNLVIWSRAALLVVVNFLWEMLGCRSDTQTIWSLKMQFTRPSSPWKKGNSHSLHSHACPPLARLCPVFTPFHLVRIILEDLNSDCAFVGGQVWRSNIRKKHWDWDCRARQNIQVWQYSRPRCRLRPLLSHFRLLISSRASSFSISCVLFYLGGNCRASCWPSFWFALQSIYTSRGRWLSRGGGVNESISTWLKCTI